MSSRVLGVAAHPDDLEWYAGGTIAKLVSEGADVTFVVCTDGDKGTYDPEAGPLQLAATRRTEQQNAARILGIREVVFLGDADGELEANKELRKRLAGLYRRYRPDLLLASDPWKRYELHPDHLAAGRAALDARVAAKMPLYHPELRDEGMHVWAIPEIWLFNPDVPNHYVQVDDTFEDQLRALAQHKSQRTVWDAVARDHLEHLAMENGKRCGAKYAEAFHKLVIEGALVLAEGTNG